MRTRTWTGAAAVVLAGVGCNVVLGIKDLSGNGLAVGTTGSGGGTSSTSTGGGGQTTGTSTSTTSASTSASTTSTTTTSATTTSTTTTSTTTTSTTTTSTTIACDGGQACAMASTCAQQSTLCLTNTCTDGCCGTSPASSSTSCMDSGGKVCDGSGACVQCNVNSDCTSPQTCGASHACVDLPSCQGLASNCGPNGNEDCCASPIVPAGAFYRSYDGVTFLDKTNPAQVSKFRLDRFNITVGRFRNFVSAVIAGWTPAAGSGKHTYVNAGAGLDNEGMGPETGWDATWTSNLATTSTAWNTNLECNGTYQTWTTFVMSNEDMPINCLTWYEAYAFCIWDAGVLPSEAEWNYAAAGGGDSQGQRVYPWSSPPSSSTIDSTYAVYGGAPILNVGTDSPKGDGRWGQAELEGTVQEWILDWDGPYYNTCSDCASLVEGAGGRVLRSGSFFTTPMYLIVSSRNDNPPLTRSAFNGARCARAP